MKRLGGLLLDRGAIAISELHTALEACHRSGGRLGTQLLKFGFVDEQALLDALSEQYGVPYISERSLRRSPSSARTAVLPDLMRRLRAVPFDSSRARVRVAMLNPRDPAAIEELSTACGATVEPHVATETAIRKVLEENLVRLSEDVESPPVNGRPAAVTMDGWDRLWEPPCLPPEAALRWAPASGRSSEARALLATYPELAPLIVSDQGQMETFDEATFCERLEEARHRDEVGECLVRYTASYLSWVCLFAVHRERVIGWMGTGRSVVIDDVQSFESALDVPSLLRTVHQSGQSFVGPIPLGGGVNEAMSRVLGEPAPTEVVLVPVRVKERTVAFVLGDVPEESVLAVPLPELYAAASKAGIAFEILILRSKIRV